MTTPHHTGDEPQSNLEDTASDRLAYQTPSERAFDKAIERDDFSAAQRIVESLLDEASDHLDNSSTSKIFTIALKEIALPMYYRAAQEQIGEVYIDSAGDVSAMYAYTVNLMEFVRKRVDALRHKSTPRTAAETAIMRLDQGALSEITVFALLSRELLGDDDDKYTVLPASQREDRGTTINGVHDGIDFKVIERVTQNIVPLQVKTSSYSIEASHYREGIAMVSLEQLAHPHSIALLQDSLLAELEGMPTNEQTDIINQASHKLLNKIERRLNRSLPIHLTDIASRQSNIS